MAVTFASVRAKLPDQFFLGLGVFLLVGVLVFVTKRVYEKSHSDPSAIKKGASLVKKSADATFACQQSESPLMALTQANYAMAYLSVARAMARDSELTECSKIPLDDLQEDIEREEKIARDRILKICPQVGVQTRVAQHAGFAAQQQGQHPHLGEPPMSLVGPMGGQYQAPMGQMAPMGQYQQASMGQMSGQLAGQYPSPMGNMGGQQMNMGQYQPMDSLRPPMPQKGTASYGTMFTPL